jgi:hypothetical protein
MVNKKSATLYIAFFLVALLGGLHFLAMYFYLYWSYWWFDILMHFLAGLAGGFTTYWVIAESGHFPRMKPSTYVWLVVLSVMVVGVAWEVFEYVNGIIDDTHEDYAIDTAVDLILDGVGAWLAAVIGIKISSSNNG